MLERTLRNRADLRPLGLHALFFGLVAYQWVATPAQPLVAVPVWLATVVLGFVGAVNTHNVIHCPPFRRPWMNDAYRVLATLWYGQPVSLFVPVHNHSHHKHAQTRKDITRSTKVDGPWQLVNLYRATQWGGAALRDCRAYLAEQKRRGKKLWTQFRWELATLAVVYLVLLVASPWRFLLYVYAPHAFGQFCIKAINFLQHDGCAYDNDGYDHSRNFTGPVFNWLFLNNGFHTVHHMRPGLHWSLLRDKHAELVAPHIHPALDVPAMIPWFWVHVVWPGERRMYDGRPFEMPPWGEGPDESWSYALDPEAQTDQQGRQARRRRESAA